MSKFQQTFLPLFILIISVSAYPQEIKDKIDEIIRNSFSKTVTYSFEKYEIKKEIKNRIESKVKQRFFGDHIFLYKIFSGDELISVGMLDNVYGKSQPITFLVLFNMDGSILTTDIVKYREPYGGGVSGKQWNRQFKRMNPSSNFKVGENISSISGATISVNSVTAGIQKLTLLFAEINK